MSVIVKTECASCFIPVKVNVDALTITVRVPSSGARGGAKSGKDFVPARTVTEFASLDSDGTLVLWDCPVCGYADSTYASAAMRKALA